jgi:threonyl-tRNA synthetase
VGKVPFMLIVGEKEEAEGRVAVRKHGQGDLGSLTVDEFVSLFQKEAALTTN